jgi:uncharacterized membrane protein YhhN
MSDLAWAFLAGAAICALFDWAAVATANKAVEYVAKPGTMLALIGVALAIDAGDETQRAFFVAALAFSIAGDVFLMLERRFFVAGLGSFLVAHLLYIAGFVAGGIGGSLLPIWAAGLVVAGAWPAWLVVRGAARAQRKLAVPVTGYVLTITAMVAFAGASAEPLAVAGALLFYSSDTMIGVSRFVRMFSAAPIAIIVTYHLGQAALVLSLID